MRFKSYSSEGIILKRFDYAEADRIVTIFSKDFGKITFIAKGVRKPTSKKRHAIELFNYIKFSAIENRGLDILIETELIDSFLNVKKDLKKSTCAFFAAEVIDKLLQDRAEHSHLFLMLQDYLSNLKKSVNLKLLRNNFTKNVLVELGYWDIDKEMDDPDLFLQTITEKKVTSIKIGRRMLQ